MNTEEGRDRHARIRERLVTLSGKHRRYGYRMLHAKLGQEGFKVNVKVVERLYREERLTLRRRNRKKIPKGVREGAWCPIAANQRWSLDFTMDALANGRKFRTVNLKDENGAKRLHEAVENLQDAQDLSELCATFMPPV